MIKYVLLSLLLFVLFVYAARWFLKRPPRYSRRVQDDLTKFFKALLDRGYDRAFLIIEAPNKRRFIQFSKYIGTKGNVGLQFDFPLAPWSEKYYSTLQKLLYDREIEYETLSTGDNTVAAFVTVDLKRDLKKAVELARLVLVEVFLLSPTDKIKLYLTNINPKDERVGF